MSKLDEFAPRGTLTVTPSENVNYYHVTPQPCPGCGRCPTCGRGGYPYPYNPYPWYPYYPYRSDQIPTITWGTSCQGDSNGLR